MSLTGIRDTDVLVLCWLEPRDLLALAQVSSYWAALCNDSFWQDRIRCDFQVDYFVGNPREQYFFLSTVTHWEAWELGRIDAIQRHRSQCRLRKWDTDLALERGHEHVFWWLIDQGMEPTVECIEIALKEGNHDIFDWLWDRGLRPRLVAQGEGPSYASPGDLHMILKLIDLGYTPQVDWADWALFTDDYESLEFLYQRGIVPDMGAFYQCCEYDSVAELEWAEHHGLPLDVGCAHSALMYGQIRVLQWLHARGIDPNGGERWVSCFWGDLSALAWLEIRGIGRFDSSHTDRALKMGWLHMVEWLLDRDIEPTPRGLEEAHPDARAWVERYEALQRRAESPSLGDESSPTDSLGAEPLPLGGESIAMHSLGAEPLPLYRKPSAMDSTRASLTGVRDTDVLILHWLGPRDLLALGQVSTYWAALCNDTRLWQDHIRCDFQVDYFVGDPREQYRFLTALHGRHHRWDLSRIDVLQLYARQRDSTPRYDTSDMVFAIEEDHEEVFWWLLEQGVTPDAECFYYAINRGNHKAVDYFWAQGMRPGEPLEPGDEPLIEPRGLAMVIKMIDFGYVPDKDWANWSLYGRDYEALEFLYQRGVVPELEAFETVCECDALGSLEWAERHGLPLSVVCANMTLVYGHIDALQWLYARGIVPAATARPSECWGDLSALEWLEEHGMGRFESDHADTALRRGWLHMVEWLLDRDIVPTPRGLLEAHPDARAWVERYEALRRRAESLSSSAL